MTDNQETITSKQLVDAVVEGIQEKKGVNITVLDLTSIENTISDYFVICDGDSNVHVDTIADSVDEYVRKTVGDKPLHVEGRDNAEWILIDYMNVVVHLFQRKVREFYNLEGLWADGERHDIANFD
ncbi:MAG: ribosome silencing factor [Bacteroidales bacterium]|jgi:ribosome-associated protein|nr:ribosome silencing factor [Bacteroidales bacterium]HBX88941.1 ribosome silencing factor [Marinilabiliaceae bacterium]